MLICVGRLKNNIRNTLLGILRQEGSRNELLNCIYRFIVCKDAICCVREEVDTARRVRWVVSGRKRGPFQDEPVQLVCPSVTAQYAKQVCVYAQDSA